MYFLSLFFITFSKGFFRLCPSQAYIQAQVKIQEIEPKQEVKMMDNVVNTPCVALLIVRAVACQAARGEH